MLTGMHIMHIQHDMAWHESGITHIGGLSQNLETRVPAQDWHAHYSHAKGAEPGTHTTAMLTGVPM